MDEVGEDLTEGRGAHAAGGAQRRDGEGRGGGGEGAFDAGVRGRRRAGFGRRGVVDDGEREGLAGLVQREGEVAARGGGAVLDREGDRGADVPQVEIGVPPVRLSRALC